MAKAGSKESEFSRPPERRASAQTIIIGDGQLLEPRQDLSRFSQKGVRQQILTDISRHCSHQLIGLGAGIQSYDGKLFYRLVQQAINAEPATYSMLTSRRI